MDRSRIHATKQIISRYSPALFGAIRRVRSHLHRRRNARIQDALVPWKAKFIARFSFIIQAGPFAGMSFHRSDAPSAYLPILIGSYEHEIHGFIEAALARQPRVIVDIGCNAGFVAVGLARRAPDAVVHAFDIDVTAQDDCRKLAAINAVTDRVVIAGECTPSHLEALCAERALVFCDCEGHELELLDPAKVPALAQADIIVELHDFMRSDVAITPAVLSRFAATHDIAVADVRPCLPADYPCLTIFPEHIRAQALHEDRVSYQQWAYLTAKAPRA